MNLELKCPVCSGRVYESRDMAHCQDCGRRGSRNEFYKASLYSNDKPPALGFIVECQSCGFTEIKLSGLKPKCEYCGSGLVRSNAVELPEGVAIIEGEKDAKTSDT